MNSRQKPKRNSDLLRYVGWGTQMFAGLALAVFAGMKADKWLHISMPLLVWVLPFVVLVLSMYKLIKETSKRKNSNADPKS